MNAESELLKKRYDEIALSGDTATTACDYNLRDLEIKFGMEFIRDGDAVLDVGCGPGVSLREYASRRKIRAFGIDYSENMVQFAEQENQKSADHLAIQVRHASVLELPYENNSMDVVTSHRCLMALLDWEKQKQALLEIRRVLKPGGVYVMMEGTIDGLQRLNFYRRKFKLPEIEADGRDRLLTLKFDEAALTTFCEPHYELLRVQRFGMYYFLTRIVQPLLVAPDKPQYDHPLNGIAKKIAAVIPDFEAMGHLVGFAWRKRDA